MLVRMEIGRDKGEVKDMPPDVAMQMLRDGKASVINYVAKEEIGVPLESKKFEPQEVAAVLSVPEDAVAGRKRKR